jgi:hypothetical protein
MERGLASEAVPLNNWGWWVNFKSQRLNGLVIFIQQTVEKSYKVVGAQEEGNRQEDTGRTGVG